MFDDKDDNLSVTYFKIFQLLRTCGNMIEETHQDFRDWHAKALMTFKNDFGERLDAQGPVTDGDMKKMREEWNQWKNKVEGRFEGLRGRFKDKQQDVMSLTGSVSFYMYTQESVADIHPSFKISSLSTRLSRVRDRIAMCSFSQLRRSYTFR